LSTAAAAADPGVASHCVSTANQISAPSLRPIQFSCAFFVDSD
jgi:hypothetical protein